MANDGKFNTNESKVVVKAKVITGEPTEFDKGYCTATADLAEKASGQRWTHQKWSRVYDECIKGRTKSVSVE